MRQLGAAVACLLVTVASACALAAAGRATGGPPLWLFSRYTSPAGAPTRENIFSSNGGSAWNNLTPGQARASQPSWSPDGTRIAYVVIRNPGGSSETDDVVVANPDGSDPRQLTSGATARLLQWSPGGSQIAYLTGDGNVWVVPVDSGAARQVATGAASADLDWSPDGRTLLYTTSNGAIAVTSVVDGTRREIAQAGSLPPESPARFSPDGRQVAYLDGHLHLRVVNSDGSDDHLATTTPAFDVQWAPNGEIVFDSSIDRRGDGFDPRYAGAPVEISIWEVTPDGTAPAPARRLTGPYTGKFRPRDFGAAASLSSDGNKMTYHTTDGIWLANSDGTCARRVPGYTNIPYGPSWNPTLSAAQTHCVDLQAFATGPRAFVRNHTSFVVVHIENHGSNPATHITVRLSSSVKAQLGDCAPICRLARIWPHATAIINVPYRPLRNGRGTLSFTVHGDQPNYSHDALSGFWTAPIRAE